MTGKLVAKSAAAAFLLAFLGAGVAVASDPDVRRYSIFRDGDRIGTQTITVKNSSETVEVNVETEIALKIAFITLYRFEHRRTETWIGDRLVSIDGRTNDDGKELAIDIAANGHGLTRTVNGRTDDFGPESDIVLFWDRDRAVSGRPRIGIMLDEVYDVSIAPAEPQTIHIDGQTFDAEFYRMTGDLDHDLWYAPDGRLLRMSFRYQGSDIEYRLQVGSG